VKARRECDILSGMFTYRVKLKKSGPEGRTYVWGSESTSGNFPSEQLLVIHPEADHVMVEVGATVRQASMTGEVSYQRETLGMIDFGSAFTVSLNGKSGVWLRCEHDVHIDCALMPARF
jgi:hypothetical protein